MTFRADSRPLVEHKRSIKMLDGASQRPRPATRVVLGDPPEPAFKGVRQIDDERFAVAWGGSYVTSRSAVEIRRLGDAALIATFPDCAAPLALCGSRMLANGPLCGGMHASTRVIDLEAKRVVTELPVAAPYVLAPSGALFARIRKRYDFESDPIADPKLVARFRALREIHDANGGVLVQTDLEGTVTFTLTEQELASPYAELRALALSRDEATLYYAGARSVGALDVRKRSIRWVKHFGANTGEHFLSIRQLAVSGDEARLAVGGTSGSGEPALRVLASRDGQLMHSAKSERIDALQFHGEVLLAGTSKGLLSLFDQRYARRDVKLASAAINDLAVMGGGVLAACNQRQLRFLPLLDDE